VYRSILENGNESYSSIVDQREVCFEARWLDLRCSPQLRQALDELAEMDDRPLRNYFRIGLARHVEAIEEAEFNSEE